MKSQPPLFHIAKTRNGLRLFLGCRQRRQKQRGQDGDDGNDDQQLDQGESPPGLPEIRIREDALANRFAAFKHMLAHAAGKIGTISHLAREPVRVDDESFFSRIAIAGKHFPEKLLTSSHNSQNGNPTVTRSTHHLRSRGRKRIFPDA
jgi:hypothetical protein